MYLARDEIAFRKKYETLLTQKLLTTVFRPGSRIYPQWRGYKPGEIVTARIIEKCGSDEKRIAPTFNTIKISVRIKNISVQNIDHLEQHDFSGSSPDVHNIQSLKTHLHHIYQKKIDHFDHQVTKINLEYIRI